MLPRRTTKCRGFRVGPKQSQLKRIIAKCHVNTLYKNERHVRELNEKKNNAPTRQGNCPLINKNEAETDISIISVADGSPPIYSAKTRK
jgi:hypothetical protein